MGLLNGKEWLRKVERDLAEAIKNNDFIYHERIPEERTLAPVAKAAVAKPTPLPERYNCTFSRTDSPKQPIANDGSTLSFRLGNSSAEMLFESLVPVPVHQACAAYEVRQTEIVNREVGKLKV